MDCLPGGHSASLFSCEYSECHESLAEERWMKPIVARCWESMGRNENLRNDFFNVSRWLFALSTSKNLPRYLLFGSTDSDPYI
jgi:hypothetical protein